MQVLYDSDSFAVVAFEIAAAGASEDLPARGGFEIVDKFARRDIFIEGAVAERFKVGAIRLMAGGPSEEEIDDYIGGFTEGSTQPLTLH